MGIISYWVYRIDRIQLLTQVALHRRSKDICAQSPPSMHVGGAGGGRL